MLTDLQFPMYALADVATTKTIFGGPAASPRLLLFTSAERANDYRHKLYLSASVIRLREPKDLRMLLSMQDQANDFDVEINPEEV